MDESSNAGTPPIPPPEAQRASTTVLEPIRRWGFWATLGFVAVIMLASLGAQIVIVFFWVVARHLAGRSPSAHEASSNGLMLSLATCASAALIVGLSWLFARIRAGRQTPMYLGFLPVPWKVLLRWSVPLFLFIVVSDSVTTLLGRPIVPPFMEKVYQTSGFLPLLWLALVIAAPLGEETLFRGFFYEGIAHSKLKPAGAIILGSILWASIHVQYDIYGIVTIFIAGLFLGYVRLKTKSIFPTMFLHGLMNLIALLETILLRRTVHSTDLAFVLP